MRIDRFLSDTATATRSEAKAAARAGEITVNGKTVSKSDIHIDPGKDVVCFRGQLVEYAENTYIMLNKPAGYVCSTDGGDGAFVLELLPEKYSRLGLFPCGRLDRDTLGLVILTDDGGLSHRLLAPKSHAKKVYSFECAFPLSKEDEELLEKGVSLGDFVSLPCEIEMSSSAKGMITLTEGKYHQIKRMLEKVGNKITRLERISFGGVALDPALSRGEWRPLSNDEITTLKGE